MDEYSGIFETTINPDLLHTLIKCKLLFGTFFMQFEKYDQALQMLNRTLFLCQKELMIRMNMNIYLKNPKRKVRMNYLNCIRTIMMVLFSMCLCYAYQKKYEKMLEALSLAMVISEKFLQRIDVLKKFISKIYSNIGEPVILFLLFIFFFFNFLNKIFICCNLIYLLIINLYYRWVILV